MTRGNLSRRGFLTQSMALLTAGAGLPAWFAREVLEAQQQNDNPPAGPNDRINMAAIGIGSPQSRGLGIYNQARALGRHIQYVAACDVDRRHLDRACEQMRMHGFGEVGRFEDYRRLLENRDIQAVTIATPDHWHTLIAIEAMRRGKDVYLEKPLTLTVNEGKELVRVARQTGRVLQTGSQQRSEYNGRFRLATELVRNGRIGQVRRIECRIGGNPRGTFRVAPVPPGLNWDMWLGPCPLVDYVPERCHYTYRWWYEYSGGKMTDWGAHHLDIAQWALNADNSGPTEVVGTGEEPSREPNSYNCHPNFTVTYTYPNNVTVVATSRPLPVTEGYNNTPRDDNGVLFEGENGRWLFVSRSRIVASDPRIIDEPLPANAIRLPVAENNNHMANFIACVRNRRRPICDVEIGHRSVTVCHIGVIATRLGRRLRWNPEREEFIDDAEANRMLSREMREGYRLQA
jgi:predicted dehydrogenase